MTYLAETILMGVTATLFMDVLAILLSKARVIRAAVTPDLVGRWVLYSLRGKFHHSDIHQTPRLNLERLAALLSHYAIGIVLAGVYLLLERQWPVISGQPWWALVFGVATVLLPWLWLYPSLGIGLLASRAPDRSTYIVTSIVNHVDFGLGMFVWVTGLRPWLT